MKINVLKQCVAILGLVTMTVGTSMTVGAMEQRETERTYSTEEMQSKKDEAEAAKRAAREAQVKDRQEKVKDRLSDARLRACEAREKTIKNVVKRASERGTKHVTRFVTIAERVESFYAKKGKTLANYDELVADVNAKKAAAQAAVQTTASSADGFSCSGDNPKASVGVFKTTIKSQEEAVKALRTSVKNLIIGVKSVQDKESSKTGGER